MRCLQCGKRLPLFRKVDGDFCSAAHAAEYATREQTAALARLKQATQHEAKAQSLWDKRRKLKNGDISPAEMRGLVALSLPSAVSHRTFQRVLAAPRPPAMAPAIPSIDRSRTARMPWISDLVPDPLDLVEGSTAPESFDHLAAAWQPRFTVDLGVDRARRAVEPQAAGLSPLENAGDPEPAAVAEPAAEAHTAGASPPQSTVDPEPAAAHAAGAIPLESTVDPEPAAEPETRPEPLIEMVEPGSVQLAIQAPEAGRIAVRIRRPYAQSTPLRPGRRPIVFVRLDARPLEYECSDPVRGPTGMLALDLAPRTVPAVVAARAGDTVAAPGRGVREFGHPARLSALALLHTAVGLAALDGMLAPVPGSRHTVAVAPEAAPVRAPGKTEPPVFTGGVRKPRSVHGLGVTAVLPVVAPRAVRSTSTQALEIAAAEPFSPVATLPAGRLRASAGTRFGAPGRMQVLPPSQDPRPRDMGPSRLASIPAEPVEGREPAWSGGSCTPPPPVSGRGMGLGSRLAGIGVPNASQPKHAVARRPEALPVPGVVAPTPPASVRQPDILAVSEPEAYPAVEREPARPDLVVASVAEPVSAAAPPFAGPVPMVFEVRIAGGEFSLGEAAPGLLPPDLETALPRYATEPVQLTVGPARSDSRQQARASAKSKSAFANPERKPQPAFGKAGKPGTKRYVPVMAPTRPTGRLGEGDPPMAQMVGIYAIVPPVRGSLAPRAIEAGLTWRKRRQTAGIRYQPAIDRFDRIGPAGGQRLKPSAPFAEKNGGARFSLVDEIGVPGGLWHSVQQRWERTPAAAKWAVPALLAIGLFVALPSRRGGVPVRGGDPDLAPPVATQRQVRAETNKSGPKPPPPGSTDGHGSQGSIPAATPGIKRPREAGWRARIRSRSAVVLVDDFRAGLGEWAGEGNWARGWAYDLAGFVRPGAIGIYSPTSEMTDYRMELLGQIDRRSIGWVVRAGDVRNYYAIKLVVAEAGPVPKVVLERYPVVRGVPGAVQRKNLHFTVRNDTSYRILTEVHGDDYAVAVQGSLVDSWTETRLDRGGVGLFSSGGDQARVRWISVTHQDDLLGKLCAFFAPPSLGRDRGANE